MNWIILGIICWPICGFLLGTLYFWMHKTAYVQRADFGVNDPFIVRVYDWLFSLICSINYNAKTDPDFIELLEIIILCSISSILAPLGFLELGVRRLITKVRRTTPATIVA